MLEFESEIDSIAFGQASTSLEGLLFISHNSSRGHEGGNLAVDPDSQLTMVDVATMRRTVIARGGTRGDVLITTSDGRVLLSQSNQVDVITPTVAPIVNSTSPADQATLPLPLPIVAVSFDQDMFAGDPTSALSVINPANYRLVGEVVGVAPVRSVVYDAQTRTALVFFDQLLADSYTLIVDSDASSFLGQSLTGDHHVRFTLAADLQPLVEFDFSNARSDRASGTVSYDVTVTNTGDNAIVLPVLLTLDPALGYPGVPTSAVGQTDDGQWLVDLSQGLSQTVRLEPGDRIVGRTVTIINPDDRRVRFAHGLAGRTLPNQAPIFTTTPLITAAVDEQYIYDADAIDPNEHPVEFVLSEAPEGMTVDRDTGVITWLPSASSAASTPVVLLAADSLGAVTTQRFVIDVLGGNRPPVFHNAQTQIELTEGQPLELQLLVSDPDADRLAVWVDNLPPGAVFDPRTRTLSWTPDYEAAGTYNDVRFSASDGLLSTETKVTIIIAENEPPLQLRAPAETTIREGDRIRFYVQNDGEVSSQLSYSSPFLPRGATLDPQTGLFSWQPNFIQAGEYRIPIVVTNGNQTAATIAEINVENANGAPGFVTLGPWQVFEGQTVSFYAHAADPDNPFYSPSIVTASGGLAETGPNTARSVSVQMSGAPEGTIFDPDTTFFQWTPDFGQSGSYQIDFTATDDGDGTGVPLSTQISVPIEVLDLNRVPQLTEIANATVTKDTVVDIPIVATDPDGDPISFSVGLESQGVPIPDFITLVDQGDGTGALHIAPQAGDRGDWAVVVNATSEATDDQVRTSSRTFILTVESLNEPPSWHFTGDAVAVVGQPLNLLLRAEDPDQEELNFTVSGLPDEANFSPGVVYGTWNLSWTPELADLGTHHAMVTVFDQGGQGAEILSAVTDLTIEVRTSNHAPQLASIGNQAVFEGELLSVQLVASDPNGDSVHFDASGLPPGAVLERDSGLLTWQPGFSDAGQYDITIVASDWHRNSTETFTIDVLNTNQPPQFIPLFDQVGREGREIRFTVNAADGDADPLLFQIVSPVSDGAGFNPNSREFFWTPSYEQAGSHVVTFAVQDPGGGLDHMEVQIDVLDVNRPPILSSSNHIAVVGESLQFKLAATDADLGTNLSFSATDLPSGAVLDGDNGNFLWTPGAGQIGDHFVTFSASDQQSVVSDVVAIRVERERTLPKVTIELTPSFPILPGQQVLVHVIADSFAEITSVSLEANGTPILVDDIGRATITWPVAGKVELMATATDEDNLVGTATRELKVRLGGDKEAPVVSLQTELEHVLLNQLLPIEGAIEDQNLDFWRLELKARDTGESRTLATGATPLTGVLVDQFDPSTLRNGFYELRLTASDIGGRESSTHALVEVNTSEKPTEYKRVEEDLVASLDGIPMVMQRTYSSLNSGTGDFGQGWSFLNRELQLTTNVEPSSHAHLGLFEPFRDDTRVYLDLPTGERVRFDFTPQEETRFGETYYRPAWSAFEGHGWELASSTQLLVRFGARYFLAETHQPYHANVHDSGSSAFTLTAPSGVEYLLDPIGQIVEQRSPGQATLFFSDSGITSSGGQSIQIQRDHADRITAITAPSGNSVTYRYDDQARLTEVRHASSASTTRYGYLSPDSVLMNTVVDENGGVAISYSPDAPPVVEPIDTFVGGASQFTANDIIGTVSQGDRTLYAFNIRESELGVAGHVILRVAVAPTIGSDFVATTPSLGEHSPLSVQTHDGQVVALYDIESSGLYQLSVPGNTTGDFVLQIQAASDVNRDGRIDGADSQLLDGGLAVYDVDGDGVTNSVDQQILGANFGFRANRAPVFDDVLPTQSTHVDLPLSIDLDQHAADPDGDAIFFHITDVSNGTAVLDATGTSIVFTPVSGYDGPASVRLVADDGSNRSATATFSVNVSAAPLESLDFQQRRVRLAVGETVVIEVTGNFSDQQDVPLPFGYVTASTADSDVASINDGGILTGQADGSTALVLTRGPISAATAIAVGEPESFSALYSQLFGIDAYPNSVTIDAIGEKQTVVQRGSELITQDPETLYFPGDRSVVDVDAQGKIIAVAEGMTTVTVIHLGAEETITVKVDRPQTGTVGVDADGAIVESGEGHQVWIGPNALSDNAMVKVDGLSEASLPIPVPEAFEFVAGMSVQITGAQVSQTLQLAAPVDSSIPAGEQVYFLREGQLPTQEGGVRDVWFMVDSGTVGDDGVARTGSPPYPGVSDQGTWLVARITQPANTVIYDLSSPRWERARLNEDGTFAGINVDAAVYGPLGVAATVHLLTTTTSVVFPALSRFATEDLEIWHDLRYDDNGTPKDTSDDVLIPDASYFETYVVPIQPDVSTVRVQLTDPPPSVHEPPVIAESGLSFDVNSRVLIIPMVSDSVGESPFDAASYSRSAQRKCSSRVTSSITRTTKSW